MLYPVILSGGAGTRLWPLSRELYPKQLLNLLGRKTLLQDTLLRLEGLCETAPLLVCNEEHRFLIAEQIRELGKTPADILLEPEGRNTAPAVTLAALALGAQKRDACMLVMPADHVIQNTSAFHTAVKQALPLAKQGKLVTFGVVPTSPETGYGYIRHGADHAVLAFTEKPNLDTARQYLQSGNYLWNSGMFLMQAPVWLEEIQKFCSAIFKYCEQAWSAGKKDGDFYRVDKNAFLASPSDSVDYAVMEKTQRAAVVVLNAGWSDIGAWSSLWEVSERDSQGNVAHGDVYLHDTRNSLFFSNHALLAGVGVDDLIVVDTADAVLVAHRDRAQDVKAIVNRLKHQGRSQSMIHRRVYRPWGSYEGLDAGERFQVKRLIVKPGAALSLQMHRHRAEHWVVVKGTARITRGDEVFLLSENESTYIPVGTKHRLENPGTTPLEIVEVQSGGYLGEDDIVRYEDQYNRHRTS